MNNVLFESLFIIQYFIKFNDTRQRRAHTFAPRHSSFTPYDNPLSSALFPVLFALV